MRPGRDLREAIRGTAHSEVQRRRDKSVPREGTLLFQERKGNGTG